jgi:5-methylcytosine-specific restriction endonuclease McrA
MPNCQNCGAYIHSEGWCIKCGISAMKGKKAKTEKPKKSNDLTKAIKRADALFSKIIRTKFDRDGFTNCCTCGKPVRTFGGTFGAHCGHLFPKFRYWLHRWDLRNAGPQCYDCNVNQEGQQIRMFSYLEKVHGQETMAELRQEIDDFDLKRKAGIIKSKPDVFFVESEIKRLKSN